MPHRSTREGRMSRVHKPAMIRSETRRLGARFRPRFRMRILASEHGFGDDGTKATRFCQSDHGNDQMNEQDEQIAHPGNSVNTSKSRRLQPKLAIRHGQVEPDSLIIGESTFLIVPTRQNRSTEQWGMAEQRASDCRPKADIPVPTAARLPRNGMSGCSFDLGFFHPTTLN